MAIAIFEDQQTRRGQKLGISTFEAWGARGVMFSAAIIGSYHIGNVLKSTALPDNAHFLIVGFVFMLGLGLAYSEAVTSKNVYTKEQPKGAGIDKVGRLKLALILLVASGMGGYSFHLNAERDNIKSTSHSTYSSSFDDEAAVLLSDRNAARSIATTSAERSQANADYRRGMMNLKREKSKHQSTKPVVVGDSEKWLKTFAYALFSLFCSSMLISLSRYLCQYYKPLIAFPFVAFQDKENESWKLDQAHGGQIEIDLAKSKKIKVDGGLSQPPIEFSGHELSNVKSSQSSADNQEPAPAQNNPTTNRPELDKTTVNGQNSVSGRTLNENTNQGANKADGYTAIKGEVLAAKLVPTVRAIKDWLRAKGIGNTDKTRSEITKRIMNKLKDDGVLILNPEQGKTKKVVAKFVLNPDYAKAANRGASKSSSNTDNRSSKQGTPYEFKAPDTIAGGIMFGDSFEYFNFGKRIKAGDELAPKWINHPDTEVESNEGVPLFTLEAEEAFRLAILTPDKQFILYDLMTENIDAAIKIISGEGQQDYNQAHRDYQAMVKKSKPSAKVAPVAGAGISIDENGISPMIGLGGIIGGKS